jgi:hypothetical protein
VRSNWIGTVLLMLVACTPTFKLEVPSGDWAVLGESPHYQYIGLRAYQDGVNGISTAQLAQLLECLETIWSLIGTVWDYPASTKIRYFKFASVEDRKRLTGADGNGEAFVEAAIVQSIWACDPHETAHVLTVPKNVPYLTPFWTEGIAMYYSWPRLSGDPTNHSSIGTWWGKPVHFWAKKHLREGTLPEIGPLLAGWRAFRDVPEAVGYPVAGSFVTFLLGAEALQPQKIQQFKAFLEQAVTLQERPQIERAFKVHFGLEVAQAETQWRQFLETWDEAQLR